MNLFELLLVGHLIGDYLLQNRWMAHGKATKWLPLLVHVTIYTLVVFLLALCDGGLSYKATLLIIVAHIILDKRSFVNFWTSKVTKSSDQFWLMIMVDQSWHIVVLALATYMSILHV